MAMPSAQSYTLSKPEFTAIRSLVYEKTGIVLADHKHDMVYSRLSRRLRELEFNSFARYIDYVKGSGEKEELDNLVNAITTNLTSFFREAHHFEHLKNNVLYPLLASNAMPKRLRIWSAGCSMGAEPYSIAMVLADCLEKHPGWDAKILATDIDSNMIAHGNKGQYANRDYDAIPASYQRFVTRQGDHTIMKPELKKLLTFKRLNLLENWPMKGLFDVIFCRNVVIYFDKETQQTLFARYRQQIKPSGRLYIGHSENLSQVSGEFALEGKTVYRPC